MRASFAWLARPRVADGVSPTRRASGVGRQQSPSAGFALTTATSVPADRAIPVFKPFLPRGHGLPCLIRAPLMAAVPVFKPDRAPAPASPFLDTEGTGNPSA